MSGLKINFSKSEVILINGDEGKSLQYAELFNCQVGSFPIRYLGVPVGPGRLHVKDWSPLIDKNDKKLYVWKGSSLSIAGRTTLINSNLSYTICLFTCSPKQWWIGWTTREELSFGMVVGQKEITF